MLFFFFFFFCHCFPSFRDIFESVVSGDDRVFRNAVLYHIYLSEVLKFSLWRPEKISCQWTNLIFIFIVENYGHIEWLYYTFHKYDTEFCISNTKSVRKELNNLHQKYLFSFYYFNIMSLYLKLKVKIMQIMKY